MISVKSASDKASKPPPPVPPRPGKQHTFQSDTQLKLKRIGPEVPHKPSVPMRTAPLPPVTTRNTQDEQLYQNHKFAPISKSQSHSVVGLSRKVPEFARSTSQDDKRRTRTVIYESSNMRAPKSEPPVESDTAAEKLDDNRNDLVSNDRNHVNTLIDEMFASVLGTRGDRSAEGDDDIDVSPDKTKITIHATAAAEDARAELEPEPKATVLIIDHKVVAGGETAAETSATTSSGDTSTSSTSERKEKRVKFDDKMNHELLISELQSMKREQERIMKRQRKPSRDAFCAQRDRDRDRDRSPKIQHSDWIEVSDGQEVRLTSCQITIDQKRDAAANDGDGDDVSTADPLVSRLAAMSSLHGLPPLPKSLSTFSFLENSGAPVAAPGSRGRNAGVSPTASTPTGHLVYPPHPRVAVNGTARDSPSSNLDAQLAILRREMVSVSRRFVSKRGYRLGADHLEFPFCPTKRPLVFPLQICLQRLLIW